MNPVRLNWSLDPTSFGKPRSAGRFQRQASMLNRRELLVLCLGAYSGATSATEFPPSPPFHEYVILELARGEASAVSFFFRSNPTGTYGDARPTIASLKSMLAELGPLSEVTAVDVIPRMKAATLRIQAVSSRPGRVQTIGLVSARSQRFGQVFFRVAEPSEYGGVRIEWIELEIPVPNASSAGQAAQLIATVNRASAAAMANPGFESTRSGSDQLKR